MRSRLPLPRAAGIAAALLGALAAPAAAQRPLRTYADAFLQPVDRTAPRVSYHLRVPDDRAAYHVEVTVERAPDPADFVIPDWAPGAYRLMNSGANLADVTAADAEGRRLEVTRAGPIRWRVATRGAATITFRYTTANRDAAAWATPNNRWFLRDRSGLVDGPRTWVYLEGHTLVPSHVRFSLPEGWQVGTGLVATPDPAVYWAPSYDVLIDSPVLLGAWHEHRWTSAGVPHRALVDLGGDAPDYDEARFTDMLRRITDATVRFWGWAPYKDYTFLYAGAGGGLEHLNSTTIGFDRARMRADAHAHAGVTAHEFFHTWNVKRLRPAVLGPFDYTRPVRTVNLWISEGLTNYYTNVLLVRSGVWDEARWTRALAAAIANHRNNPGRLTISPERASWTAWDGPAANGGRAISYYLQGELLGLLLDLAVRDSTANRVGLDDWMRWMYDHHAGERGFTSEEALTGFRHAAGLDLHDFWRRYVSGTDTIPWNDLLALGGWRATMTPALSAEPDVRLGFAAPAVQDGRWRLLPVAESAAERAGLRAGDELVRVNGAAVRDAAAARAALAAVPAGQAVTVEVLRDGVPVTARWKAERYRTLAVTVDDLPTITPRQRAIRHAILGG